MYEEPRKLREDINKLREDMMQGFQEPAGNLA